MSKKATQKAGRHAGAKNPQSKLTEVEVREIRKLAEAGTRQIDLAAQFGITQGRVSAIVRREAWKHVD